MKAIVQTKYGSPDVLQFKEVEKPAPKDNEVLVRIYATAVTAAHCAMRKGPIYGRPVTGLTGPKNPIPGTDFAGEIEAVGKDVTRFKVGDQGFGSPDTDFGCYAEYKSMPEEGVLASKPANMSFEEATAIVDGALTALPFLRDAGNIQTATLQKFVNAKWCLSQYCPWAANSPSNAMDINERKQKGNLIAHRFAVIKRKE